MNKTKNRILRQQSSFSKDRKIWFLHLDIFINFLFFNIFHEFDYSHSLPYLYRIPKFHKNPIGSRFITGDSGPTNNNGDFITRLHYSINQSPICSTTGASIFLDNNLKAILKIIDMKDEKNIQRNRKQVHADALLLLM
jgi:hypothetical protein